MSIKVYGASDDLIEIEGDINEEFHDDFGYLGFSDGTLLYIEYTNNGFWRINRMVEGTSEYRKTEGMDEDDDYSDYVFLDGNIKWVVFGVIRGE